MNEMQELPEKVASSARTFLPMFVVLHACNRGLYPVLRTGGLTPGQ
jgi:hypothetical protein